MYGNTARSVGASPAASGAAFDAVRRLSSAQRRYLARLPERGFNVLRIEGCRMSTVRTLDGLALIERGRHGLHDARLTPLGRQARSIVQVASHN